MISHVHTNHNVAEWSTNFPFFEKKKFFQVIVFIEFDNLLWCYSPLICYFHGFGVGKRLSDLQNRRFGVLFLDQKLRFDIFRSITISNEIIRTSPHWYDWPECDQWFHLKASDIHRAHQQEKESQVNWVTFTKSSEWPIYPTPPLRTVHVSYAIKFTGTSTRECYHFQCPIPRRFKYTIDFCHEKQSWGGGSKFMTHPCIPWIHDETIRIIFFHWRDLVEVRSFS